MKYSVILPCFNEAHNIIETLPSLKKAVGVRQDIEIIVVDNGSTDESATLARQFGAKVITCDRVTISTTRNIGARHGLGEYFYFLDIDIAVPEELFAVLDRFVDGKIHDVLGFVDLAPADSPWFAYTWSLRSLARREKYQPVEWLPGRNIFVPRTLFEQIGGFNEDLRTGEDKDFVFRLRQAGAKVASDSHLLLQPLGYERTFGEWCRKEFWRQHSHLHLLVLQGIRPRLLRFPLLALFHVIFGGYFCFSVYSPAAFSPVFVIIWLLPSLAQTVAFRVSRMAGCRFPQFWVLFFLRFHIAGVAFLHELFQRCCQRGR